MNEDNSVRYWQIFSGVLVIAMGVFFFSFRSFHTEMDQLMQANENTAAVGGLDSFRLSQDTELTVHDQFPGTIVSIASVTLPDGGWVVITRENEEPLSDSTSGLMGRSYFSGRGQTGSVDLLTPTVEGSHYTAWLYQDNGDKVFSPVDDTSFLTPSGGSYHVSFVATRDLPEEKG